MRERMPDYPPEYDDDNLFAVAEQARQYILSNHGTCCSGWRRDSWFFHGKGWECQHGESSGARVLAAADGARVLPAVVCVEMGVNLTLEGATTYWIFDNDSTTMSEDYGETIPYPKEDEPGEWEKWHTKLVAQLDQAAEAAWNNDVLTCSVCGYHYGCDWFVDGDQCCPVDDEEDQ